MAEFLEMVSKGEMIKMDISDRACMRFGFKHGQRIIDPRGDKGVVMGVAPVDEGKPDVLWFAYDCDGGEVSYWEVNVDLEEEGFRRIDLTQEEVLSEMTICFRVTASTNGKAEAVIVRDVATAAAQGRIFRCAGHKAFQTNPVKVIFDEDGRRGSWFEEKFIEIVTVLDAPAPSRYTRADFNPGISLRRYEREVLERPRATTGQALCAAVTTIVMMAIPIGSLINGAAWGAEATGYQNGVMVSAIATGAIAGLAIVLRWANACVRAAEWVAGITPSDEYYAK